MRFSHTLSTCKRYVSVSIVVLAMTLFLAGCPSPNDPAPNDSKPLLTITATQASVTEGSTSTFTITRDNVESALEVSLTLSGSAEHNVDYTVDSTVNTDSTTGEKTMTVDFEESNKSVTFTITAKNDQDTEATGETVEIEINESDDYTIGNPSTATLTIVDPLPVVSISTSGENNINEDESISVTITSNQQVPNGLEVILTIGGTATIDEDYELSDVTTNTSGGTVTATVTIPGGDTETMLTINATNDSIHELNANLTITISDEPSTYRIKEGEKTVTVTITDDDLPTVGFRTTSQTQTLDEGDAESVTVTVERSNDEALLPLEVQLSFAGSATINEDYALPGVTTTTSGGTVTIPLGRDTLTFTITGIDDGDVEGNEEVIITISEMPSAYTIDKDKNEVTITILDDGNRDDDSTDDSFDVDDDNNGLIEIHNLEMLRNVHFNLAGTSYDDEEDDGSGTGDPGDTNGGPTELTAHCSTLVNKVYLCGYELMRDLDFNDAKSYATGIIKEEWRPNVADNSNNSTNAGFPGIGAKTGTSGGFTGIFEGNGHSISNLYMRNTTTQGYNTGLFRLTEAGAKIRNLGMTNVALYGGVRDNDFVGGLVGYNNGGTITASYVTGTVDGGAGDQGRAGGLVGRNRGGTITASYASGTVDGGAGDSDDVGGLVGLNTGTITASYATGTVDGGDGNDDVGGLVGTNFGTITASYATGTVDGGAGNDSVGGLVGDNFGTTTASYGFGTPSGETVNSDDTTKPNNVNEAFDLTKDNAGSEWNDAVSNTLGAWDFGTSDQNPALKYADYDDDAGTTYSCGPVPTCGDLLPGQRE